MTYIGYNENGVLPMASAERYIAFKHKGSKIIMPKLIKEYNCGMRGIDRFDNNESRYQASIRGTKYVYTHYFSYERGY